jgi:hypothetical protein
VESCLLICIRSSYKTYYWNWRRTHWGTTLAMYTLERQLVQMTYKSLQVNQRSYSQVGHRVLSDMKRVSLLKLSDKILPGRSESESESIPCRSDSLHSQIVKLRYDNVTLSPLLLPARITNRSHSTYGSSARSDSHWAVFCSNSVVNGWIN